ncbi:unnamed protein product [Rotaria sp. Silwood2]|nr:unnamed protein product [Rotaria sp. Silwood2]CAF4575600.1 unnamed protein product [Rotaria sp. Silwood2]
MKNFSLIKNTTTSNTSDANTINGCTNNDNSINISNFQYQGSNFNGNISLSAACQSNISIEIDNTNVEMIDSETQNQDSLCTPTAMGVLENKNTDLQVLFQKEAKLQDNCNHSDTISDSEEENNNNIIERSSVNSNHLDSKMADIQHSNIPNFSPKSLPGVIFMHSQEMEFVDKQRAAHPNIKWYSDDIDQHQKHNDIHRSSRERRILLKNIEDNGNIIGQLKCYNMQQKTEKYLSTIVEVFWYILTEEMPLIKFKPLIQLLDRVHCPGVAEWMNLSNNKQKYWGKEAISEWLLSINAYIYQQQLASIRKTDFINLIVDETQDISVRKMVSICLRYIEKDTGTIQEQLFKIKPITDTSGEGCFFMIEKLITQLEKDAGKRFTVTAQTYDGVSTVKDSGEDDFYDAFDTVKSTLSFIRDSPQRLEILLNCQKLNGTSKRGHTVPKASKIRWSYNYEILRFTVKHYLPIVQTLTTISQLKTDGSSDAKRYSVVLLKYETVFEIMMLRNIFKISMKFLRQIESRGSCLDSFSLHVQAATASISKVAQDFDFQSFKSLMWNLQQHAPTITATAHSTRHKRKEVSTAIFSEDFSEDDLRKDGEEIVMAILDSLSNKFDSEAKELVENLSMLSTPSKFTPDELLQNGLVHTYTNEISYEHTSVDKRKFKRTDSPLLNINRLKKDVHSFLVLTQDLNTIQSIIQQLAKHGQEQAPEWYKLYQVLGTFAIGSNEAERSFSTLRRIKSWQRNRISDSTVEICIKASTLASSLSNEATQFIIRDFISHPGRAESRNITIFMNNSDEEQDSDDE